MLDSERSAYVLRVHDNIGERCDGTEARRRELPFRLGSVGFEEGRALAAFAAHSGSGGSVEVSTVARDLHEDLGQRRLEDPHEVRDHIANGPTFAKTRSGPLAGVDR